ncbi:hypothetical protein [Lachnoclostridium phytofermentans]
MGNTRFHYLESVTIANDGHKHAFRFYNLN